MTDPSETPPPRPPGRRGRLPGSPRTPGSGRKKGVPNKLNGTIHDMMKALGCDPRMILARIAMNPKNSPELRRKCASDLMNFMYPRLASTDQHVTGDGSMQPQIINIISGIARLPNSPIDVSPEAVALPAPEVSLSAVAGTPPAPVFAEVFDELPAGRSWQPSSPSVPQPASPSSDRLHDSNLQRERSDDAKVASINGTALKYIA